MADLKFYTVKGGNSEHNVKQLAYESQRMKATGIGALYTVVMQSIACQSLFGKDSGLYQNLTKSL